MPIPDPHAPLMARIYHARGIAWPGELEFYLDLAAQATAQGQPVLEVACGTGRIAVRLAQAGAQVTGFDLSPAMLEVASQHSRGLAGLRWLEADMRSFNIRAAGGETQTFGLILVPGHSFQHLLTIPDQLACLERVRRHLAPGGRFVLHLDHQDFAWLGNLKGDFEPGEDLTDPLTGHHVRTQRAWAYQPSSQTAVALTRWQELDGASRLLDQWQTGPVQFHCFFRYEVEHLLHRAGFQVEALYGDFHRGELTNASTEMIWLTQAAA